MLESITIPLTMEHYHIFRKMYHGGRVLATVMKYDSKLWSLVKKPESYDEWKNFRQDLLSLHPLLDDLKMVDVVSLYPSVMKDMLYPCGSYDITSFITEEQGKELATNITNTILIGKYTKVAPDEVDALFGDFVFENKVENPDYQVLKDEMFASFYCCDLDAHPDMIVAFLMRRNEEKNDKPEQTLAPLRKHWLTGLCS